MPASAKTIFKNTFWLSLSEVISAVLLFFLTVVLAKYLGASNFGRLSFALTFTTLLAVLLDFGLSTLTTREVARNKEYIQKFLNGIVTIRLFFGIAYFIFIFLVVNISGQDKIIIQLVMLLGLYMFFHYLNQGFISIFRAFEKMRYEAISRLIFSMLILSLTLIATKFNLGLVYFGLFYVISSFFAVTYSFIVAWSKFTHFKLYFDKKFWSYLIKESWPFALSLIFTSIYFYMDSIMLGFMGQDREVGWYNAVYKIVFFVLLIAGIIGTVFFPVISRLFKESFEELKKVLNYFSKIMIILSLPIGFGGLILAEPIIKFIFGAEYLGGKLAFQILIWSGVVVFISVIYANVLQACDKQKKHLLAVGLGAGLNIVLNLILIPKYSLNGAAVATIISQAFMLFVVFIQVKKFISLTFLQYLLKSLLAALAMSLVVYYLKGLNIFIPIFAGIFVYLVIIIILKLLRPRELYFLRDLISKKLTEN